MSRKYRASEIRYVGKYSFHIRNGTVDSAAYSFSFPVNKIIQSGKPSHASSAYDKRNIFRGSKSFVNRINNLLIKFARAFTHPRPDAIVRKHPGNSRFS